MTTRPTDDDLAQWKRLAESADDDGYTGRDGYGHLTVSPAVFLALIAEVEALRAERGRALRSADRWRASARECPQRADLAEAERDAALARIEKVRALLDEAAAQAGAIERNILGGVALRPKEIRRALDGGEEGT